MIADGPRLRSANRCDRNIQASAQVSPIAAMRYDANAAKIKEFVARDVDHQSGEMPSVRHFDNKYHAEPRFEPCGCFAQPGSVAEILRAWSEIDEYDLGR